MVIFQNSICLVLPYFTTFPFPLLYDSQASDKLPLSSGDTKGYHVLLCDLTIIKEYLLPSLLVNKLFSEIQHISILGASIKSLQTPKAT